MYSLEIDKLRELIGRRNGFMKRRMLLLVVLAGMILCGNVYADIWMNNSPGWDASNSQADSMAAYNGFLYVGTAHFGGNGSEVWSYDGTTWVNSTPSWGSGNVDVWSMTVYNGYLYAGTQNFSAAQVWKKDGTTWTNVSPGWGSINQSAMSMTTYNGILYAGTAASSGGAQVWSYDGTTWTNVSTATTPWGSPSTNAESMAVYNNLLYIGFRNSTNGAQVWSYDGTTWTNVSTTTPPWVSTCIHAYSMAVYNGLLYVGLRHINGGQVWSYDGTTWTNVSPAWTSVYAAQSMIVSNGRLYVGTYATDPAQVWSYDGTTWTNVSPAWSTSYAYSMAVYGGRLYAGTTDYSTGAQVWSALATTVIFPAATGNGNITLTTNSSGCGFTSYGARTEAQVGNDPSYDYPYGLVEFSLNCAQADVTITFPGSISATTYRKYGPTTPGNAATNAWYTFNDVSANGSNSIILHLTDGQLGDDTDEDGMIVDSGGPGQQGNDPVSVPTMTEWGMILFMALAGIGSVYFLRRQKKAMS